MQDRKLLLPMSSKYVQEVRLDHLDSTRLELGSAIGELRLETTCLTDSPGAVNEHTGRREEPSEWMNSE